MGIPREQIAFIHEANTEVRKKELFAKIRSGQVRVLMGSTFKMGAGMNVQDRLVALHDLDCPWRPGDVGQTLRTVSFLGMLLEIKEGSNNSECVVDTATAPAKRQVLYCGIIVLFLSTFCK